MPWKRCPHCKGLSYSAATRYETWFCPYCQKDIAKTEDYQPSRNEIEQASEES